MRIHEWRCRAAGSIPSLLTTLSVLVLFTACGGGGGSSTSGAPAPGVPANQAPVFVSNPPASAKEGHAYAYTINVTDANGDAVALSLVAQPAGAVLDGATRTISWTPTGAQAGTAQSFDVLASDGKGGTAHQTWGVTSSLNAAPVLTSTPSGTGAVGAAYTYSPTATDADGDAVSFRLITAPSWASLSGSVVTGTPASGGIYDLTLRADDGYGKITDQSWTVTVIPPGNQPPVITSVPSPGATGGVAYTYILQATDPNGDAVTFQLVNAPSGALLVGNTLSWTPSSAQERVPSSFTVQATDVWGATSTPQTWDVVPSGTVVGTKVITYHNTTGTQSVPVDLSTLPIAAWVPDGKGGFLKRIGVGAADGTFSITGVPAGTYLLQFGASSFYSMKASVLDMGFDAWGRTDRVPVTVDPTNLVLNLSNLSPWQVGDELHWFDETTGTFIPATAWDLTTNAPTQGAMALSAATLNLNLFVRRGFPVFLADTTRGDHPRLCQMASQTIPGSTAIYQTPARSYQPSPLVQTDGTVSGLTGTFTTVPLSNSFPYYLKGSEFSALRTAVHPLAVPSYSYFWADLNPAGTLGILSPTPDVIEMNTSAIGGTDQNIGNLAYANPFPASWPLFWVQSYAFSVSYTLPALTGSRSVNGYLYAYSSSTPSAAAPIRPTISPVQGVALNGQPWTAPVAGAGLTPTITWLAPALGTSTHSTVYVSRLYSDGTTVPAYELVAGLTTMGNGLQIPPGVLVSGETYFMRIRTYHRSGQQEASPFRDKQVEVAIADCLTFTFRP